MPCGASGERIAEASDAGDPGRLWVGCGIRIAPGVSNNGSNGTASSVIARSEDGPVARWESIASVLGEGTDRRKGKAATNPPRMIRIPRVRFRTEKGLASWMVKKTSLVLETHI